MALPYQGRGLTIGIGIESTWGSPVSITNWLRAKSADIDRRVTKKVSENLGQVGETANVARVQPVFTESDNVDGPMVFEMAYDDSTVLLVEHALGANVTTGAGPYVHTNTLATPLPTGLTLEQVDGTGTSETFEGCKIDTWTFTQAEQSVLEFECTVIGQTSATRGAAPTPTYSSGGNLMHYFQCGALSWNARTPTMVSWKATGNNGLERRPLLGSTYTAEPSPTGMVKVELEVVIEYTLAEGDDIKADYLAGTNADLTFTYTGTGNNAATFTLHNAIIVELSKPVSSRGRIMQTVKYEGFSDGTDYGFKLAITNDNTANTDN